MPAETREIVRRAEKTFDQGGFAGSSIDDLARAAGVSTRTLYKHVGSKAGLVNAVLEDRRVRFLDVENASGGVRDLFEHLERWVSIEGARGCLFLRAAGETSATSDSTHVIEAYHRDLVQLITDRCAIDLGEAPPQDLVEQVLVLFEGATSAASYRGAPAVVAGRDAAETLISAALKH